MKNLKRLKCTCATSVPRNLQYSWDSTGTQNLMKVDRLFLNQGRNSQGKADLEMWALWKIYKELWNTKTQPGSLRLHKHAHKGEKPHIFTFCSKTFTQIGALSLHKVIRTGEREWGKCEKTSPQAKRHQPSLLITSLAISTSLTFITS